MKFHKKQLSSLKAEIQVCARAHIYIHIHTEHSKFISLVSMFFFFKEGKQSRNEKNQHTGKLYISYQLNAHVSLFI